MNHAYNRPDHNIGRVVASAVSVGWRRAIVFGTISPKTTEIIVSEMRTPALASDSAVSGRSDGHRAISGASCGVITASA